MGAASASATTPGSGSVRRDRGVFGTTLCFSSGLFCHSTRTVRAPAQRSTARSAAVQTGGDSPWRPGSRPPVGRGRRRCRPSAARPRAAAMSLEGAPGRDPTSTPAPRMGARWRAGEIPGDAGDVLLDQRGDPRCAGSASCRLTRRAPRRDDALSTHVGDGTGEGVDDPVGVSVGVVVSSGGTVGDTVGLGVGVGKAEGVAVDVGDGVTLGVGSADAVPDGELPVLGGIPAPDGTSTRAVEERANRSALVDAESPIGTREGAGRNPTGGATSLGGPEPASSASRCLGKGCRTLAGAPMAVVAVCSGTSSFDGTPIIATIAATAKQPATTTSSLASSSSRPISPAASQCARTSRFRTVTRSMTIREIPFRWSDRRPWDSCRRPRGVRANPDRVPSSLPLRCFCPPRPHWPWPRPTAHASASSSPHMREAST
jgi:hypothetical protein